MGKTARFEVSLYTAAGAACLARAWCSKLQHFYDIWVGTGSAIKYVFSKADFASWSEPADFTELASSLIATKAVNRADKLRSQLPCRR